MTIRQDADTAAQERYYKCVDGFIVQSSDTSLDLIYDGLLKTEKVKVCVLFVDRALSSMEQ